MQRLFLLLFVACAALTPACNPTGEGTDDDGPLLPSFDRQSMLATWADEVISPALTDYAAATEALATAADRFVQDPTAAELDQLRASYRTAYLSWQRFSPFQTTFAEQLTLRQRTNTYPTDPALIAFNADRPDRPLDLPSQFTAQGFPALDYLLYADDAWLLNADDNDAARRAYVLRLAETLRDLAATTTTNWNREVRDAYVMNDGNSATASVDRTVNDYIFYFEKFLRAGKVGIPAGVFSDTPLADRAEAHYSGLSKELYFAGLDAVTDFFTNKGLTDYLDALEVERDGELLSALIREQFAAIRSAATGLDANFATQVETDNMAMLNAYDEMQRQVVLLKVDMLQALSINVDYVDADGD